MCKVLEYDNSMLISFPNKAFVHKDLKVPISSDLDVYIMVLIDFMFQYEVTHRRGPLRRFVRISFI